MSKFEGLGGKPIKSKFDGLGGSPVTTNPTNQNIVEPSFGDYGQAFTQGLAKGAGKLVDTGVAAVNATAGAIAKGGANIASQIGAESLRAPLAEASGKLFDSAKDYWQNPKVEQIASDTFDTGFDTKGIRTAQAAGQTAVELLPFGAAAKGVQFLTKAGGLAKLPWIDKLNKFLNVDINAANAASFAGMGAGAEALKSDDPNTSATENVAREIVGGILGGTIPHAGMRAAKGVVDAVIHPLETAKGVGTTILAETTGGKVNKEAVEAAKKLGLHLPPGLATDSNIAKSIENTALKSWFTSKTYNEVIEKIPQNIIKEIDRNLDEIGIKVAGTDYKAASSVASDEYKAALQSQSEAWKQEAKTLFDNALKSLNETDVMAAPKTLEAVKSVKAELSYGVRAPEGAKKALIDDLTQLETRLASGNVPVRDLIAEQQDLSRLGKYGDTEGFESYYNGIAGAITDELATYKSNLAFTENYMPARAFYKENVINKLRSDVAKSILQEQSPKEAFAYMSTPSRIKELENILGNHENAKEIIGSLKRAKISQILQNQGVITTTGDFSSANFLRMFSKESNEPLLKALMGENYSKVQANIMPIAKTMSSSSKVLANPSGTANVTKDYGAIGAIGGIATGVATGSSAVGVTGALGGPTVINLISRAFASPQYLEKLIVRSKRMERLAEIKQNPVRELKNIGTKKAVEILSKPSIKYQALKLQLPKKKEEEKR